MLYDLLGQEIKVGDIVVRGVRAGNSGAVSIGVVTSVKDDDLRVYGRRCYESRSVVIDPASIDLAHVDASARREIEAARVKRAELLKP